MDAALDGRNPSEKELEPLRLQHIPFHSWPGESASSWLLTTSRVTLWLLIDVVYYNRPSLKYLSTSNTPILPPTSHETLPIALQNQVSKQKGMFPDYAVSCDVYVHVRCKYFCVIRRITDTWKAKIWQINSASGDWGKPVGKVYGWIMWAVSITDAPIYQLNIVSVAICLEANKLVSGTGNSQCLSVLAWHFCTA